MATPVLWEEPEEGIEAEVDDLAELAEPEEEGEDLADRDAAFASTKQVIGATARRLNCQLRTCNALLRLAADCERLGQPDLARQVDQLHMKIRRGITDSR